LNSEGAAVLNNIRVRNEILTNTAGIMDIGINGKPANLAGYEAIYQDWQSGAMTKEEAMRRIGNVYGTSEHPSAEPNLGYEQYYRNWATAHLPPCP